MPSIAEPKPCLCGEPDCISRTGLFAPGHDQRYLGQCLDRISDGDATGADDMEQHIPGHVRHYDMDCLRDSVGQDRQTLPQCRRR